MARVRLGLGLGVRWGSGWGGPVAQSRVALGIGLQMRWSSGSGNSRWPRARVALVLGLGWRRGLVWGGSCGRPEAVRVSKVSGESDPVEFPVNLLKKITPPDLFFITFKDYC